VLRADVGEVIGLINKHHPKSPLVLAGESMGGLLATDYAWRGERRLAALGLVAPAFGILPPKLDPADLLTPGFISLVSDVRLRPSSRDIGFVRARRDDPLALRKVSMADYLVWRLGGLQAEVALAADNIKLPVFVAVGGKDQIIDVAATKRVYARFATPNEQKTWLQWDDAYHTLCWDPVAPALFDEFARWALHIAGASDN
jgi:alpha-beta hydrolase superfamily lysophospholipase